MELEPYVTGTGQKIRVHTPEKCDGSFCSIHEPSDHHMKGWPTHWRPDRGIMERICPCSAGVPDPDDLAFRISQGEDPDYAGIYGCGNADECFCLPPKEKIIDGKKEGR